MRVKRSNVVVVVASGLVAFVGCLPVFGLVAGDDWDGMLAVLALPGVLLTAMVAAKTKSFSPWLIFGFTWLFYAVVFLLLVLAVRGVRGLLREE